MAMPGALSFSVRDIYPAAGTRETSTDVVPDRDDMSALVESEKDAQEADKGARGKNIAIAAIIMVAVVALLGGAG